MVSTLTTYVIPPGACITCNKHVHKYKHDMYEFRQRYVQEPALYVSIYTYGHVHKYKTT